MFQTIGELLTSRAERKAALRRTAAVARATAFLARLRSEQLRVALRSLLPLRCRYCGLADLGTPKCYGCGSPRG